MKRAIVHIGHPKTATTFLQHVMLLNRRTFADAGFCIPADYSAYGHRDYEQLAKRGAVFSGNGAPLSSELRQNRPLDQFDPIFSDVSMSVLLSSELFFYYPKHVELLARFLSKHRFAVDIIAYVGRHESMAVKAYCQNIRNHGFHGSLVEFLRSEQGWYMLRYHHVRQQLAAIAEVRDVQFRAFAPQYMRNGRIEDDFLSLISENLTAENLVQPRITINSTLTLPELEAIRQLNRTGNNAAVQRIIARERQVDGGERTRIHNYYLTKQARTHIAENLSEDRDKFAAGMPADQRALWAFETEDLPEVRLDPREVQAVLDFALG